MDGKPLLRFGPAKGLLEGFEMRKRSLDLEPAPLLVQVRPTVPSGPEESENQLVAGKPGSLLRIQAQQERGMGGREGGDSGVAAQIGQPLGG